METAAEHVSQHLAESGWRVTVYCLEYGTGPIREDTWNGVQRVTIPVDAEPPAGGKVRFDLLSIRHALRHHSDVWLTLGYNTGLFNVANKMWGIPLVVNMDGMTWARSRFGRTRQSLLWANERIACAVADVLIADHPEIEARITRFARPDKVRMIAYGGPEVTDASEDPVVELGLEPASFMSVVCRPIPENSLLEIVRGFSVAHRGCSLAVLGTLTPSTDDYHRAVMDAASDEVRFLGSIYDPHIVSALRFHSLAYLHGHSVGGTNPSLVEAMGAGNPVIAHDNKYNRWTAGPEAAEYFRSSDDVDRLVGSLLEDSARRGAMSRASRERFRAAFTWQQIAGEYEDVLRSCIV